MKTGIKERLLRSFFPKPSKISKMTFWQFIVEKIKNASKSNKPVVKPAEQRDEEFSRFESFVPPPKDELEELEVHKTPPGSWPFKAPQPSKIPVVLFYLSVVFTVIGTLICIKLSFLVKVKNMIFKAIFRPQKSIFLG